MNKALKAAFEALQKINAPVLEREDCKESFIISAESNDNAYWADYYGEFAKFNDPYVCPEIVNILTRFGLYYEWESPGHLSAWVN